MELPKTHNQHNFILIYWINKDHQVFWRVQYNEEKVTSYINHKTNLMNYKDLMMHLIELKDLLYQNFYLFYPQLVRVTNKVFQFEKTLAQNECSHRLLHKPLTQDLALL